MKTKPVTHWWWALCSPHISLHTGCWSIRGSRGSFPWRWSADPTAAFCSRCIGNTRGARAYLGRSLRLLWWPRGDTNPDKARVNESTQWYFICYALFYYAATVQVMLKDKAQGGFSVLQQYIKHAAVTLPSYKHSTGRHIASRSRAHRSSRCLLGWRTWFLLAAGSGGTGSRSHASCSPCIPFFGNLAQGIRAA